MMVSEKPKEIPAAVTYEEALSRLEEVVKQMEERELPLEESLARFEEGVQLIRFCRARLREIESKVEILLKNQGGEECALPFDLEEG